MMNFLPLCKAIIQHQRVNKGNYRFGIKNRKADDMRYKKIRFHFLSIVPDWLLLPEPRPKGLQNRFFLLETHPVPLFIITGILFVYGVLNGE